MIEPKELLGPTVTLFAVIFAIFMFLFTRALTLYRERQISLSEAEVPDDIRMKFGFKIGTLGDIILLFMTSVLLLILGIVYCPTLLHRIISYYLGSELFSNADILSDFRDLTFWFGILSSVILLAVFALLSNDIFVSKRLPTIIRVYVGRVLGQKATKAETDSLLPEARILYEKGAFGESVLYSVASLELALKDKLDLPEGIGFGRLFGSVKDKLEGIIDVEELVEIRRVRNIAAHPSHEKHVDKRDAEHVLKSVEKILQSLQGSYQVVLTELAKEQLDTLYGRNYDNVNKAILLLGQDPRPKKVKRLAKGDFWLIKVGRYRILYSIDDEQSQVTVAEVTKSTRHL